ncbi:MAG TPA: ABC transporter ATP-binding protein [Candidatus Sulfotelmatobacter sp.]|nr:ABC transporter ATP-binding protein [Candidatus Sulfotelmatobacter sp.]
MVYELSGVSRTYRTGSALIEAVKSVDLAIDGTGLVVIQGRSGSGKSTLLQMMGGLDRPDSGQIRFQGNDLARLREGKLTQLRRLAFGFVFQAFNLIPTLSAAENVEAAAAPTRGGSSERRRLIARLLDEVGLTSRARHLPSRLSGGEQQRVAIARALVNNPSVLLADEPTGNLDSRTSAEIIGLLSRLSAERDLTVVVVTHDPAVAAQATRRLTMEDGHLAES